MQTPTPADLWRFCVSASDYRRGARLLTGQPKLDVVFICNVRDEAERAVFYRAGSDHTVQENGPRMHLHGVAGQIRGINFTAAEMYSRDGRQKAKAAFVRAVEWSAEQGAKVILLAASTKRLFGRDGAELKRQFPHLLFTLGDNGTALLLCHDIDRALARTGLEGRRPRLLVLGAYGILGTAVCEHLRARGLDFVGFGSNPALLKTFAREHGVPVVSDLEQVGHVDLVVACTHGAESKLTAAHIARLRRNHRRLVVIDVAEPANLERDVWLECRDQLVRQDAGNAYSPDLHYVLGSFSHRRLMLPRGTVFGCFAEAMALHHAIYREHNHTLLTQDWFAVHAANQALVAEAFKSVNVGLPEPCSFGEPVRDFDVELQPAGDVASRTQTVAAAS